eukprot:9495825-Alexandrium_andersonii.AAC.1
MPRCRRSILFVVWVLAQVSGRDGADGVQGSCPQHVVEWACCFRVGAAALQAIGHLRAPVRTEVAR